MTAIGDALIGYAANAVSGRGGQGEFLRQMVYAVDQLPRGRVLSRQAEARRAECVDIPFSGWRQLCFRAVASTPGLRGRTDLLTLFSDLDFDAKLSAHVEGIHLLDGVMAQCCEAFERLSQTNTPLVLTALNAHIDDVSDALADEHRRLGISAPSFVHPMMQQRVRREIACARRIRVISEVARQSFIARGVKPDAVEVVLPAVDLEHFRPVQQQDDVFRVLAVLTIDPRKGAYYLLQAFEKAAIPRSELVIIGATGDRWSSHMLQQFLGRVPNVRIQSADVLRQPIEETYGPASVFVHPAIEDGFALAVGQALACGKPVITTRQTGACELIRDDVNGYVLECRDVDGLVDRLQWLARDESRRRRMGDAAPHAVAHLSYSEVARNVARLYDRVLAES